MQLFELNLVLFIEGFKRRSVYSQKVFVYTDSHIIWQTITSFENNIINIISFLNYEVQIL